MDKMPLVTLLFLALPEGMLAYSLGLAIMKVRPLFSRMLIFGALYAVSVFILRGLPVAPGLHIVILIVVCPVYIIILYRIPFKKAVTAAILALIFIALGELLFIPLIMRIFSLTPEQIMQNPWLRVLVSLPQQFFLAAVLLFCYRLRGFHKTGKTLGAS